MSNDESKEENAGGESNASKLEANGSMESSENESNESYADSIESASSTMTTPSSTPQPSGKDQEMKRLAFKKAVERYFYQLRIGCGKENCENEYCASSGKIKPMSPNEAAALSLQLLKCGAKLCITNDANKKIDQNLTCQTSNFALSTTPNCSGSSYSTTPNDSEPSSSSSSSSRNARSHINTQMLAAASLLSPNVASDSSSACDTEIIPLLIDQADIEASSRYDSIDLPMDSDSNSKNQSYSSKRLIVVSGPPTPNFEPVLFLNEEIIDKLIEEGKEANNFEHLIHALNQVLCDFFSLSNSFTLEKPSDDKKHSDSAGVSEESLLMGTLNKEDLRTLEGEQEKDVDDSSQHEAQTATTGTSVEDDRVEALAQEFEWLDELLHLETDQPSRSVEDCEKEAILTVDLESLRRVKKKIFDLQNQEVNDSINNNLMMLATLINHQNEHFGYRFRILHCIVIAFEIITNTSKSYIDMEFVDRALPKLCFTTSILPVYILAKLVQIWSIHCKDNLRSLIECCQQLITLKVIADEDRIHENLDIMSATKLLRIIYYASILAGEYDSPKSYLPKEEKKNSSGETSTAAENSRQTYVYDDVSLFSLNGKSLLPLQENRLEMLLGLNAVDSRVPYIPFEEFYNEPLSDAIHMDNDYLHYKNLLMDPSSENDNFSFMTCSFILSPTSKVVALYYDSRIRMYSERNSTLFSILNYYGQEEISARPDLRLKVRRENIIDDALINLEIIAMANPKDLKKQLVVEFIGEQGVDEGGVSKEFFQLIIDEIFNPDFGMFVQMEETKSMWFNSAPFENEAQFTLIGIILGLAIYNNIILAVNFPQVVYRKLMNGRGIYHDLKDWSPTIFKSLESMLNYEGDDMAEVFMQTFKISYQTVFGEVIEHDLKENAGEIFVEQHNKQEFVDLYADFLLNKSIERQFKAFKKGFDMVTDESPLKLLFRPDEIELLVCGSRKFDFQELEKSTEYEGGYTKDSQTIKDFWTIVHGMSDELKRKLLEFTTGSDRVPVGGFSRLKLLITRNGTDSDRLPTSHTCFNVLLLPEYSSKEKLEDRLLKAINYSKGFGML